MGGFDAMSKPYSYSKTQLGGYASPGRGIAVAPGREGHAVIRRVAELLYSSCNHDTYPYPSKIQAKWLVIIPKAITSFPYTSLISVVPSAGHKWTQASK